MSVCQTDERSRHPAAGTVLAGYFPKRTCPGQWLFDNGYNDLSVSNFQETGRGQDQQGGDQQAPMEHRSMWPVGADLIVRIRVRIVKFIGVRRSLFGLLYLLNPGRFFGGGR